MPFALTQFQSEWSQTMLSAAHFVCNCCARLVQLGTKGIREDASLPHVPCLVLMQGTRARLSLTFHVAPPESLRPIR
eukprot:1478729-Amphidinium_carterae.1